jgi:hypothetical protein
MRARSDPRSRRDAAATLMSVVVIGASVAYFGLWACAPQAAMPPMIRDGPTIRAEHGAAVGALYAGKTTTATAWTSGPVRPTIQAWTALPVSENFEIGATAFGDGATGGGLGGLLRWRAVDLQHFQLGIQFAAGWLFGVLALPMSLSMDEATWLYATPSLGLQLQPLKLSLGLARRIAEGVRLNVEVSVGPSNGPTPLIGSSAAIGLSFTR